MLNNEQLDVVNHVYGPAVVLAGAGSGKTHTLISRVEKLSHITEPHKIVALTFTNAAAESMKMRAANVNNACKDIIACTYHKYCGMMLRKYGRAIGINPSFSILSKQQYNTFIDFIKSSNEYYETLKDFPSASKLSDIFSIITNTDATIASLIYNKKYQNYEAEIQNLYNEVKQAGLEQQKLCFDDLLVYMNKLLEQKDICEKIATSFEFLMVDEFQDTNDLQLRMLLQLSEYNSNILVVGDLSQSIYKFRGARVQNIQNFIDSFKSCDTYTLTTNYRSTQEILDATNNMMNTHVRSWKYLNMIADNKHGDKPVIKHHANDYDQAEWIINKIKHELLQGYDLNQIAIIERKSMSSFKLENELIRADIPFIKMGGFKFNEYTVVNDLLSFLSVVVKKTDKFSWFTVLKFIPKIGVKTATSIAEHCNESDFLLKYTKKSYGKDLAELSDKIKEFATKTEDIRNLITDIANYYFALREAKANKLTSSSARFDALDKIDKDKLITEVFKDMSNHYDNVISFIDDIVLESINNKDEDDQLVLTTIHSAKGLEWPIVIILDAIESDNLSSDDEEELRCMYVAMTRAEKELVISIPDISIVNGLVTYNELIHYIDKSDKFFNIL